MLQTPARRGRAEPTRRRLRLLRLLDLRRRRRRRHRDVVRRPARAAARDRRCTTPSRSSTSSRSTPRKTTRAVRRDRSGSEVNLVNLRENIEPTRGSRPPRAREGRRPPRAARVRLRKLVSGSSAAHAAQAEPRELGDPAARAASASTSTPSPDRRRRGRPTDSAMPTSALREHAPVLVGCRDLDQLGDRRRRRRRSDLVDDAANSGSLRIDAPNSSRNAARLSATNRK